MRSSRVVSMVCGLAVCVCGVVWFAGCEDAPTEVGINVRLEAPNDRQDETGEVVIALDESITLVAEPANTNRSLYLPLEWSVADPNMGVIVASGGFTAVYRAGRRPGSNAIRVQDQAGAHGTTAINQRDFVE